MYLPDGLRLTTPEGKIFKHTAGDVVAVGPDYYPITERGKKTLADIDSKQELIGWMFYRWFCGHRTKRQCGNHSPT